MQWTLSANAFEWHQTMSWRCPSGSLVPSIFSAVLNCDIVWRSLRLSDVPDLVLPEQTITQAMHNSDSVYKCSCVCADGWVQFDTSECWVWQTRDSAVLPPSTKLCLCESTDTIYVQTSLHEQLNFTLHLILCTQRAEGSQAEIGHLSTPNSRWRRSVLLWFKNPFRLNW